MQPINATHSLSKSTLFEPVVAPLKVNHIDTISPAAKLAPDIAYTPKRPELTKVADLSLSTYRLLAVTDESRQLGDQLLETLGVRLRCIKESISKLLTENIEKLREASKLATQNNLWSLLKKVATCLLSTISMVVGISVVASGASAFIGGALIASGILSLANFALSELKIWDIVADKLCHENEERKKQIALLLPATFGVIAGGIGLIGSVYALTTGAVHLTQKALLIAQTMLSIFDNVTTFGKGVSDARLLWAQADTTKTQTQLKVEKEKAASTMQEMRSCMNYFNAVQSKVKKLIQTISQSQIQLVRQG